MNSLERLKKWISESRRIVFFGGAGVSTESGIPDFRSVDGLYRQKFEYPPERIISHSFFEQDPEYFQAQFRQPEIYHGERMTAGKIFAGLIGDHGGDGGKRH